MRHWMLGYNKEKALLEPDNIKGSTINDKGGAEENFKMAWEGTAGEG